MDRENQYYSIIKSIVEQHKKYAGLEAILDDIIDDVYSHSEIILKSVANESVINAYLAKVVSTSIITVPKKMNFHSEIRHRTVTVEKPAKDNYTKPDNSLVDKMINSFDTKEIVVKDNAKEEKVVQNSDNAQNEIVSIEAVTTEVNPEESFENNIQIELNDNNNLEDNLLIVNEPNEEVYTKVDNSLVDKMINSPERIETMTFAEDSSDSIIATDDDELLNNEFQEENLEQDLSIVQDDTITLEPEESDEEELSALDVVNIESVEQTEIIEDNTLDEEVSPIVFTNETEDIIEETESLAFEDLGVDSDINAIQSELFESSNEIVLESAAAAAAEEEEEEEEELLLETDEELNNEFLEDEIEEQTEDTDPNNELELFDNDEPGLNVEIDDNDSLTIAEDILSESDENISFADSLVEETDTDEVLELEIADDKSEENSVSGFKPLDYSSFEFVPDIENNNLDVSLIVKELENLDNKKPELDIINVYNLKYKENMQISQIASKLEMSEDLVIEALNEIIAVV